MEDQRRHLTPGKAKKVFPEEKVLEEVLRDE